MVSGRTVDCPGLLRQRRHYRKVSTAAGQNQGDGAE